MSTLFFVGDRVYKSKKPVKTGFLDFSDCDARARACHLEVELNRRLAPDVYLGVADISMDGAAIDHVVVMRRLPEARRLSARLDLPTARDDVRRVAHLIAAFHASARRSHEIDEASGAAAVARLWREGFDQLRPFVGGVLGPDDVQRAEMLAGEYLAGRGSLLDGRVERGLACDGHGDLQAEDIFVLDDGPRVLDCLEFDDRLRYGDVLADVAFLAMDLERLGHPGLARYFLDQYRELSADQWPASLGDLHVAYRAFVRAKVACIRFGQGAEEAGGTARNLWRLTLDHLESARVRLVVVGGSPGTGKSVLSRELADRLDATIVSSDVVRDELMPRADGGGDPLDAGRYSPARLRAVYDEVLRRCELLLAEGVSVVADASWLDPVERERASQLAHGLSAHFTELRCDCPDDVAADRVARRAAGGGDPSEATPEVARQLARRAREWTGATVIDTTVPVGEAAGLAEAVATRP